MSISPTPNLAAAAAGSAAQALLIGTITGDDPALVAELEAWFALPAAARARVRRHVLAVELALPGHPRTAPAEPSPRVLRRRART